MNLVCNTERNGGAGRLKFCCNMRMNFIDGFIRTIKLEKMNAFIKKIQRKYGQDNP